eukprot:TRINITY_DN5371_c0_g1_i1.p1 TRINITY_DN5371_c0_g1~~TRINITY_DN5371_c0_g1_i1.p1  ORF type:complete len:366 (-),score=62.04 TRINITY_DN5371_c0_g1_i1:296-1393(-)
MEALLSVPLSGDSCYALHATLSWPWLCPNGQQNDRLAYSGRLATKTSSERNEWPSQASISCMATVKGASVSQHSTRSPVSKRRRSAFIFSGHVIQASVAAGYDGEGAAAVVVTREKGKNEKLIQALANKGIKCLEMPLIETQEGPDAHVLLVRLQADTFEWIVITSPEAAAVFLEAWGKAGRPAVRVAAVGGGTGEVLSGARGGRSEDTALSVSFVPSIATGKVLAEELPRLGENDRVLYPASVKAGSDLEKGLQRRGFSVTRLNTYSTVTVGGLDRDISRAAAAAPVVTFASPTAVKAWMELVVAPLNPAWSGAAACIGATSAEAARRAGLRGRILHPQEPGIDGWVESILEALEESGSLSATI